MIEVVHSIIPGLFSNKDPVKSLECAPTIYKMLSKATAIPNKPCSYEAALRGCFTGLSPHELPLGALYAKALGVSVEKERSVWMCAELVSLKADSNTVYCDSVESCNLEAAEKALLTDVVAQYFQEEQMKLVVTDNGSWLLQLNELPKLSTNQLENVIGKPIHYLLPSGEDQGVWHRRFTECQMLLTQHPVNQARQRDAKPMANGLWFWGLGSMPSSLSSSFDRYLSNQIDVKALCLLANKSNDNLDESSLVKQRDDEKILFVDSTLLNNRTLNAENYLSALEKRFFKPLLEALTEGRIKKATFDVCQGFRYELSKRHLRYFWRRTIGT